MGGRAPAGILGAERVHPHGRGLELDLADLDGFPVALGHGTYDPILSVDFAREAQERLEAAGADVLYRESPMDHSIDPGFLPELREWLKKATA